MDTRWPLPICTMCVGSPTAAISSSCQSPPDSEFETDTLRVDDAAEEIEPMQQHLAPILGSRGSNRRGRDPQQSPPLGKNLLPKQTRSIKCESPGIAPVSDIRTPLSAKNVEMTM